MRIFQAVTALFVGCAIAACSTGRREPTGTQEQPAESAAPICRDLADGAGVHFETASSDDALLTYERDLFRGTDSSERTTRTRIARSGATVISIETRHRGESTNIRLDYGNGVRGVRHAEFDVTAKVITGTIDGRAMVPRRVGDRTQARAFLDGAPAPEFVIEPATKSAVTAFAARATDQASACFGRAPAGKIGGEPEAIGSAADPLTGGEAPDMANSLTGHLSVGCLACQGVCTFDLGVCAAGCIFGWPGDFPDCESSCYDAMKTCFSYGCQSDCCPVACPGPDICCDNGESCIMGQNNIGSCCKAGTTPCAGVNCCFAGQQCIPTGLNAGSCCDAGKACGGSCCGDGEQCVGGVCCGNQKACGGTCCGAFQECLDDNVTCCGGPGQEACGSECCKNGASCCNGGCCDGECANGACCNQGESACGSVCCPSGVPCDDPATSTCGSKCSTLQIGQWGFVKNVCQPKKAGAPEHCCLAQQDCCSAGCCPFGTYCSPCDDTCIPNGISCVK